MEEKRNQQKPPSQDERGYGDRDKQAEQQRDKSSQQPGDKSDGKATGQPGESKK